MSNKKKLIVTIALMLASGALGFVETLIPTLLAFTPMFKLDFAVLLAIFVVLFYGYAESMLVIGVRCLVFGLVTGDPTAIITSLVAYLAMLLFVWGINKLQKLGIVALCATGGMIFYLFNACFDAILMKSGHVFATLPSSMLFGAVWYAILGTLVWVALMLLGKWSKKQAAAV